MPVYHLLKIDVKHGEKMHNYLRVLPMVCETYQPVPGQRGGLCLCLILLRLVPRCGT